jgi:hypothetical protein
MSAMHRRVIMACLPLLLCARCATHGVAHVAPDESRPHISWEIRSGSNEGDEDFMCGSAQPGPCMLTASTEKNRTLATVHLFVHPAAQPTSYLGLCARLSSKESWIENSERSMRPLSPIVGPLGRP